MKQVWGSPSVMVQEFEANEYVAACWGVGCDWEWANQYEKDNGYWNKGNVSHAEDHCGNSSNQVIFDDNDDGIGDRMIETGTDGLGNLRCTIYKSITANGTYTGQMAASQVHVGDTIYWTTSAGSRTWHHKGTVYATAEGHPNRS